ncbi:sigma-70 family RNA polymerase sigma factor [Sphaerisporangium corydalis]|uniref:Sigma-70 family RNA polymerase sigma factor n=1 Tax=Sphaerisporangium corydalis TaxID=1441875 RepID=A0ABV9EPH9_9ACTN|nr:sigma-70 family RNA polymerase sigma factor [Sphaerisporangium corydalis]
MRGTGRSGPDTAMVTAARDGDQRALDALVADSLPLLYNIVGRALNGHDDVDDVVQETLLRVVRALPGLRDPEAYRSWLVAIAVREVRDHEQDRRTTQNRRADLDTATELPDPASDFAAVTILRLGLTDQRREVAEATRWLDGEDRALLALWWLEETGELGRADLAGALGLSGRHAAVRVQRMKEQVQTARTVTRALHADPRCPELRSLAWNWDGAPSPLWRKRFARHVRDCAVCGRRTTGLLPIDRLLSGLPLLPVPAALLLRHLPDASPAAQAAAAHLPSGPDAGYAGPDTGYPGPDAGHLALGPDAEHLSFGPDAVARALPGARPRGLLSSLSHSQVAVPAAVAGVVAVVTGAVVAGHLTAPAPRAAPPPAAAPASPSPSETPTPSPSPTPRRASATPKPSPKAAVPASSARKGVGVWRAPGVGAALARSRASWYYTWSTRHDGIGASKAVRFVPMVWGSGSVTPAALAQARSAGPYLLAFNEPDMPAQANMSVEKALSLWPKLMAAGRVLSSPAVAFDGDKPGGWLGRFMSGAAARGYRVDFIALHWYGADFRAPAATAQLKSYLQAVYKRYRKPIWLTEYALIDFSKGTRFASDAQQAAFVTASTRMMATLPYVRRYAWFGLPSSGAEPNSGLFRADGTPTRAGRAFQAAP